MKCPICKKELVLPNYAWYNVESYQKLVIVVSKCCEKPIVLGPKMMYTVEEYTGDQEDDDWGTEIKRDKP